MPLFKSNTHQGVWREHWCERCWHNMRCPILAGALSSQRKPRQWDRNPRAREIKDTYKCNEFTMQPPRIPKADKQFEDVSMFGDDTPYRTDVGYVPVEGWPDDPRSKRGPDHA